MVRDEENYISSLNYSLTKMSERINYKFDKGGSMYGLWDIMQIIKVEWKGHL